MGAIIEGDGAEEPSIDEIRDLKQIDDITSASASAWLEKVNMALAGQFTSTSARGCSSWTVVDLEMGSIDRLRSFPNAPIHSRQTTLVMLYCRFTYQGNPAAGADDDSEFTIFCLDLF